MEPKDYIREEELLPVLEGGVPSDGRSEELDEENKIAGEVNVKAMEK